MLNYLQKFEAIEILAQNEQQTISTAHPINAPSELVTITQLKKQFLPIPFEADSIIRSFSSLKFLEEDAENWYIVTSRYEGTPFSAENVRYSDTSFHLTTENFIQFLMIAKHYEVLSPIYQNILLDVSQFTLFDNKLVSSEVLDLTMIKTHSNEFSEVKSQVLQLISHFIARLIHTEPHSYNHINWTPMYDVSENLLSLTQLCDYWLQEIEKIQRLQPTPLNELYAVQAQAVQTPAAVRRQKELEKQAVLVSLQQSSKTRSTKLNPAIILTLAVVAVLACIFVVPGIFDSLKQTEQPKNITILDTAPNDQTSNNSTQPATTGNDVDVDPLEKLPIEQLAFLTDNLQYDTSRFYSGDRSIRLTLDSKHASGSIQLSDISLNKNTNLTLWMMSSKAGAVKMKLSFYQDQKLIKDLSYLATFESEESWYMMNPISTRGDLDLSDANRLVIEISGVPQTLWIDDISLESFK